MKKFKKIIAMCLATVMAMSVMCVGAFAAEDNAEPVESYIAEDGTKVKIYDPNISVTIADAPLETRLSIPATSIYIPQASTERYGNTTDSFISDVSNGYAKFIVTVFQGGPNYNVSLVKQLGSTPSSSDTVCAVMEDRTIGTEVILDGLSSGATYYFRVSTWGTPGAAYYRASTNN